MKEMLIDGKASDRHEQSESTSVTKHFKGGTRY